MLLITFLPYYFSLNVLLPQQITPPSKIGKTVKLLKYHPSKWCSKLFITGKEIYKLCKHWTHDVILIVTKILIATSFWKKYFMPFIESFLYLVVAPCLNTKIIWVPYLMMWSLTFLHVSSWGQLLKPIGDAGLYFISWIDILPLGDNCFGFPINYAWCPH